MIYTIGHAINYRTSIAKNGTIQKLGRDGRKPKKYPDYPGGYAFKTWRDAVKRIEEAYQDKGFAIFGLEADWERDTIPSTEGWWHHLINDSDIVVI